MISKGFFRSIGLAMVVCLLGSGCDSKVESNVDTTVTVDSMSIYSNNFESSIHENSGKDNNNSDENTHMTQTDRDDIESSEIQSISTTESNESNLSDDELSTTTSTTPSKDDSIPEYKPEDWTETPCSYDRYVNTEGVYSRQKPIQGHQISKKYDLNDKVSIVATTSTNYCKTSDGDYIHQDYLSKDKIEIQQSSSNAIPQDPKPNQNGYIDEGAWLKIPKPNSSYDLSDKRTLMVKYLCPSYGELMKQIPGYVSGEFCFNNETPNTTNMKFSHLTEENANRLWELCNHFYDDLTRIGWGNTKNELGEERYLTAMRRQISSFIDLKYCATNSNIGEYAPDGAPYIDKNLDGICHTGQTELSHLYWLLTPRKLTQVPQNVYLKQSGLGYDIKYEPTSGYHDISNSYIISLYQNTMLSDNDYKEKWFSTDHNGWVAGLSEWPCIE